MKVARGQLHRISGAVQQKPHGERVREGDTPSCWGGGGGCHGKFLNFAYPEMHNYFWCIFRAKKCSFGGHCKMNYKQEFSSKYHEEKCSNDFYSVDTWLTEI